MYSYSCLYLFRRLKDFGRYFYSAMISKYIIRALYKKYSKPPRNFSELNIDEFVSICGDSYGITVDDVSMTFGQMSEDNRFVPFCCVIYTV